MPRGSRSRPQWMQLGRGGALPPPPSPLPPRPSLCPSRPRSCSQSLQRGGKERILGLEGWVQGASRAAACVCVCGGGGVNRELEGRGCQMERRKSRDAQAEVVERFARAVTGREGARPHRGRRKVLGGSPAGGHTWVKPPACWPEALAGSRREAPLAEHRKSCQEVGAAWLWEHSSTSCDFETVCALPSSTPPPRAGAPRGPGLGLFHPAPSQLAQGSAEM